MSNGLRLSILTLDRNLYDGEVKKIITVSTGGSIEILKRHTPLITTLKPSITTFIDVNDAEHKLFISSGVLKVQDGAVKILCDAAEWPDEIDVNRAAASKSRAEERLKQTEEVDVKRAELALYKSLIRLKLKE
jgi:F-type H+-transporting ATPase subunit epsilon